MSVSVRLVASKSFDLGSGVKIKFDMYTNRRAVKVQRVAIPSREPVRSFGKEAVTRIEKEEAVFWSKLAHFVWQLVQQTILRCIIEPDVDVGFRKAEMLYEGHCGSLSHLRTRGEQA
jgi:hypothetical protein